MFTPRFAHCLVVLCLLSGTALWPDSQPTAASLGNLPLSFVRQGDQFSARGQGYLIGLDSGAATIQTLSQKTGDLSIGFLHGQRSTAVAGPKLRGVVNYIFGSDPHKWQMGLPAFDRVTYPEVYPGIDVVYYGNQQQLEFDLVVKPGADPRAIRMKIRGGGKLSIDSDGALEVAGISGLRIALPKIYQEVSGARKNIAGHFSIRGTDEVAFRVDAWDRTRPLVIDPAIVYSRLLTGGLGNSEGAGIAVDASGNVLVTGDTAAADFPLVNSYCNGLGSVHGPNGEAAPNDGAAAPLNLIYSTDATATANLSTTSPGAFSGSVPVLFSGLTPSLAGLYQVNIQLPYLGDIYGNVTESLTIKTQVGSIAQSNQVYIYVH